MEPDAPPVPFDDLLRHSAWVRALARSLVRDDADAGDAEQDAWVAAVRRPPADAETARAWLATVVRNAVRARGRAGARRARREEAAARPEAVEATVDVVARAEQHRRLVLAVMDLDEPYRSTVLLRFFEDLPPRDIAERMAVPVETVRTRTRRALDILRSRLDAEERGDRAKWRVALLPLAGTGADDARPQKGPDMRLLKLVAVALVAVAGSVGWVVLAGHDDPPAAAAPGGSAGDEGAPVVPKPRARAAAPAPESPDDGPAVAVEGAPDDDSGAGAVRRLDDEDPATFADGVLELTLAVDPPSPRAKDPFDVVATFRNGGKGPLRFHVPEHTGLVPFPDLLLRGDDGTRWVVATPPFQSMWAKGVQGAVVRLEPGTSHVVRTRVAGVARIPEGADAARAARSDRSEQLPPGGYVLEATLARERALVPWGEEAFRVSTREVPGLWTGRIAAAPVSFRLASPNEPILTLRGPERVVPGSAQDLVLEISNPTPDDHELRGALALRRTEKGGPAWGAWFAFGERGAVAAPDAGATLRVRAGETRTCRLDVGALRWETVATRDGRREALPWPHVRNYAAVWVTCGERAADGAEPIGSNTAFVGFEPAPDLSAAGLACEIDASEALAERPVVTVRLRNDGTEPLRVPRALARRVVFTIAAGRESRPAPVPVADPGAADDIVTLTTGESIASRVPLRSGWAVDLAAGSYELRAHWANADGRDAATIGRVSCAPETLVVR